MNDVPNAQNTMGVELESFYSLIKKLKALIILDNSKNKTLIISIYFSKNILLKQKSEQKNSNVFISCYLNKYDFKKKL
jgi:hypothetical protein